MAWQDVMTEILRVMVDDLAETKYTDAILERVLAVAAFQVQLEPLRFTRAFVVDLDQTTITPDPTDTINETNDDSFVNLVCLKAACTIDRGSAGTAASQAIAVKDGTSAIDLRGILAGKMQLLSKGWCAVYADTKLEYQTGQVAIAGAVVMTPFRLIGCPRGVQQISNHFLEGE